MKIQKVEQDKEMQQVRNREGYRNSQKMELEEANRKMKEDYEEQVSQGRDREIFWTQRYQEALMLNYN